MIAAHAVPAPESRELRACALAALAEACAIVLPLHLVLTESRGLRVSPAALAVPFLAAFIGGATLACRFRASRNVPTSAVIAAVLAGVAVGGADVNTTAFAAVAALLVALRVVTLGLRDWRSPIHAEIGWGALAIGVEAMIASGAEPDWRPLLVAFVPTFFVAALASRATTVWTSGVQDLDERVRASWIRRAVLVTGALVAAMALAVGLSVRGGVFDRIGRLLTPVAEALVAGLAWLMAQAARPVFWLVDRLGIDPAGVREFLDRLRTGGLGDRDDLAPGETALWQRLLGLLAFAAVAYGLYRVLRRSRAHVALEEPRAPRVSVSTSAVEGEASPPHRPAFRRELPADAVRRLYAEALLALRRADVRKEPALTPAEFVPEVAEAFPSCEAGFAELTRAYEDVRYGSLRLDPARVRALEREQRRIVAAVRDSGLRR